MKTTYAGTGLVVDRLSRTDEQETKRPSVNELREMADRSRDPVVEQALRQLAHDIEDELAPDIRREANPDNA